MLHWPFSLCLGSFRMCLRRISLEKRISSLFSSFALYLNWSSIRILYLTISNRSISAKHQTNSNLSFITEIRQQWSSLRLHRIRHLSMSTTTEMFTLFTHSITFDIRSDIPSIIFQYIDSDFLWSHSLLEREKFFTLNKNNNNLVHVDVFSFSSRWLNNEPFSTGVVYYF